MSDRLDYPAILEPVILGSTERSNSTPTTAKYQVCISGRPKEELIRKLQYDLQKLLQNPHNNDRILILLAGKGLIDHLELEPILKNVERKTEFGRMLELFLIFYHKKHEVFMEFLNMLANLPNQEIVAAEVRNILESFYPGSVQVTIQNPSTASGSNPTPSLCISRNEEAENENNIIQPENNLPSNVIEGEFDRSESISNVPSGGNRQLVGHNEPEEHILLPINSSEPRSAEKDYSGFKTCSKLSKMKKLVLLLAVVILSTILLTTYIYFNFWNKDNSHQSSNDTVIVVSAPATSTTESDQSSAEAYENVVNSQEYNYSFSKKNSSKFGLDNVFG